MPWAAEGPAAAAGDLEQEDIVLVDMGADTAAVAGQRDHDVVDAPAGQEAEQRDQAVVARLPHLNGLDQHAPAARGQTVEAFLGEWAALKREGIALAADQARGDAILHGDREQVLRLDPPGRGIERLRTEQRPALPVAGQEGGRIHAAGKPKRLLRHRTSPFRKGQV